MKFRVSILSLAAVSVGVLALPACWDAATLKVTDLGPPGDDAGPAIPDGSTADGGPPPACAPGLALCGAACTDTSADPLNCGACGNDCTTTPPAPTCVGTVATMSGPGMCVAGGCQFPTQTMDCALVNRACTSGTCGACVAGFQDNDLDGTCVPDCATAALGCGGNGTCSDASGTPVCVCMPGFTGPLCGTNIDDCSPNPCVNGGTCVDGVATHTCQCIGGFTGPNCEVPPVGPIAFVSSGVKKGDMGGLAGADAYCQGLAAAKGLPGTFKALMSDGASSAATRLGRPAGSYKLVTGTVVAATANDLFGGALLAPVDRDEAGALVQSAEVWTGSSGTGAASGSHCNNWTVATAAQFGTEGVNAFVDGRWLSSYSQFCDRDGRVYCVQQ